MSETKPIFDRSQILKSAVILTFTIARILTVVVRSRFLGGEKDLDASWLMGLAALFQQGALSGRDFHFTYGVMAQAAAWFATFLTATHSAFDAYRMMGVVFGFLTAITLAAVLFLYDRISWQQTAIVCACATAMNLLFEIPSLRIALLLLCAAFSYRTVSARTVRLQIVWALASAFLCFASQLVTPDIGIYGAAAILGTLILNYLLKKDTQNAAIVGLFLTTLILLNVGIDLFFKLSASTYGRLFNYQFYALETMRGYNNTMGVNWELDRVRTSFLVLLLVYTILAAAMVVRRAPRKDRCLVTGLMIVSILSLKTAFVRSDIGHITYAASPLVCTFLILGKKDWHPKLGQLTWCVFLVGLLMTWPWVSWNAFDFLQGIRGPSSFTSALHEMADLSFPPEAILPLHMLTPELRNRVSTPMLLFPYENYISAVLKRPLLAPVLQSYSASTEALQRFYISSVERQRPAGVEVVYGLDSVAAWPVDGEQTISRVPLIFNYLYRNFELPLTPEHKDGHYTLEPRAHPRDVVVQDLPFTVDRFSASSGAINLQRPAVCGLVQMDIRMIYSAKKLLLRPSGMDLAFSNGAEPVSAVSIRPQKLDTSFSTYVSLVMPQNFYKFFQSTVVPARVWDTVMYQRSAADMLSAKPQNIEIRDLQCVNQKIFVEEYPSADIPEAQLLFPPEIEGGAIQVGFAVITAESGDTPNVNAKIGVSGGAYAELSVNPGTTQQTIKLTSVIAKEVGVGMVNPGTMPIVLGMVYRDSQRVRSVSLKLLPKQHVSKLLPEMMPVSIGEILSGSLEFRSTLPFSVVALRMAGREVESLPAVISKPAEGERSTSLILPQFVMHGGWATALIISNPNDSAAKGRIEIFSSSGEPMPTKMNGRTSSVHNYSVAPGRVYALWPGAPAGSPQ